MTAGEIAQAQPANSDASKFLHVVTNLVKHPADLAVDTLPQDHMKTSWFNRLNLVHPGSLAIECHPPQQLWSERRIPRPIERDLVFLLDLVTRMSEALRQIAVVCENQKSLGLGVEPADVEKARQVR